MDGENRFLFGCFLVGHVVGLYVFKIEKNSSHLIGRCEFYKFYSNF